MARTGKTKDEIREYIIREFGYDLSRACDEIRPGYYHVETCQQTVPEAITAFREGTDFEDVIRTAVSLGGDCDTLTCIAGGIAEAFYEVPPELKRSCETMLPEDMRSVLLRFSEMRGQSRKQHPRNSAEARIIRLPHFHFPFPQKRRVRKRKPSVFSAGCQLSVTECVDMFTSENSFVRCLCSCCEFSSR